MSGLNVIYLAIGYPYLVMAANSARTLRKASPGCRVTVITDMPLKSVEMGGISLFDDVIVQPQAENSGFAKFQIYEHAEENNLFLDCDTEIWGQLDVLGAIPFDMAVRVLNRPTKKSYELAAGLMATESGVCELNSGVFFFRKSDACASFFRRWGAYYEDMGLRPDQPSMLRAFVDEPQLRLLPLAPNWNARPLQKEGTDLPLIQAAPGAVRVMHYRNPAWWPDAGVRLSEVFFDAEWQFTTSDAAMQETRASFEARFRLYRHPLFRSKLGRRVLALSGSADRLKPRRGLYHAESGGRAG